MEELLKSLPPETAEKLGAAIRQAYVTRAQSEKAQKVERFRRLNKFVKPGQILFAGSSLMEQFPINEFQQLFAIPLHIYNRGVGGFTTEEMLEVMGPCVYDVKPKYIFLNIGTNDLNTPDFDLDALMDRYGKILDGIQQHLPETRITLLAYYPVNETIGQKNPVMGSVFRVRTNARIRQANAAVARLAEKYGAKFLNVNAGITDADGNQKAEYTIEGMHMYADGYYEVLRLLLPSLMECK